MSEEVMSDRLQQLWKEGHRSMAIAFLKRALTPESTLAEVEAILKFDAVSGALDSVRLSDVLGGGAEERAGTALLAPRAAPRPAAGPRPTVAAARGRNLGTKKKRTRRGPREMQEIKDFVLGMLLRESGSLDTNQIEAGLAREGHRMDRITLNRMLSSLEQESHLVCLGGRPKAWRAEQPNKVLSAG